MLPISTHNNNGKSCDMHFCDEKCSKYGCYCEWIVNRVAIAMINMIVYVIWNMTFLKK